MTPVPANACTLYVFGSVDGSKIKIGKTRQRAELRMLQHAKFGPERVEMRPLALLWGQDSDETALKAYWKSRGAPLNPQFSIEWINPNHREFRDWLRFLRMQAYVALSFEEFDKAGFVDSRYWLPNAKNRADRSQSRFEFSADPYADLTLEEETEGDYYTPPEIIDAARQTMGGIDLDPASCRAANSNVRASRIFGALQDGLSQEWRGPRIWLNPPFGQWDQWGAKLLSEIASGRTREALVMAPTRSICNLDFHPIIQKCDAIFISRGRIQCWGPKASSPFDGHAIFYFGPHTSQMSNAFSPLGTVFFSRLPSMQHMEAAE